MTLKDTIQKASLILKNNFVNSHYLDAEVILSNIMKTSREFIILNEDLELSSLTIKKYNKAINKRVKKEPVAYIVGKKEFWSHNFTVDKFTLIPRPETELLVHEVVNLYKNKSINILDVGTGSGCILLSILKELKKSRGMGLDISNKAIRVAKKNAKELKLLNRTHFKTGDINELQYCEYDLIVSNPPYIPTRDLRNLSRDIMNYEPLCALNGGIDGLDLIKKVIYKSNKLLKKSGKLAIEIGNNQYKKVSYILMKSGFREVKKVYDNNYRVRCIISTK